MSALTLAAPPRLGRLAAFACAVVALLLLALAVAEIPDALNGRGPVGWDLRLYLEDARRFLATGTPYAPWQLAGPYDSFHGEVFLYPPNALYLILPFLVLPAVLWWAIPLAIIGWALWRLRPAPWTWPLMALCVAWPRSLGSLMAGNTDLWAAAFVAAGMVVGWPAVLVALKPSFAPLALVGMRHRSWWLAAVLLALASLPLLPLWWQYVSVVRFGNAPLVYSLLNLPICLIGLLAALPRLWTPSG